MTEVISNVSNKYIFAEEATFGTLPSPFTALDIGYVQTISISEDNQVEEVSSINTEHTLALLEDSLYNLSGSITTKCTKASLPVLMESLFGKITYDSPGAGQYTAVTSPVTTTTLSYSMKFNTQAGKIMEMRGIAITGGEINVEKDGSVEITLNYQAQILEGASETLTVSTDTGTLFKDLDCYVTYGAGPTILQSFSISMDWNIDLGDSRGIEVAHANGRRVISRVVRNALSLTGSFESEMDATIDAEYADERSDVAIVLVLSRGTDNDHTFTIAASRTTTKSRDLSTDSSSKKISCDFVGKDIALVGEYS